MFMSCFLSSDGAVLSEIYRQRLFPAILHRSIGIVVGERYSETNSSHQGRRVYRGHGGFDIVANKWAEIIKLVWCLLDLRSVTFEHRGIIRGI